MYARILKTSIFIVLVYSLTAAAESPDYFPFDRGYYWTYDITPVGDSSWPQMSLRREVEAVDVYHAGEYFRVRRTEVGTDNISYLWFQEDDEGNVTLCASGRSPDIASAMNYYDPPGQYYTRDFNVLGNTGEYEYDSQIELFSVESVMETVVVPAGTFINCIKIRTTTIESTGDTASVSLKYFARDAGEVLYVQELPENRAFRAELAEYLTEKPVAVDHSSTVPAAFALKQNYPNPFNPATTLEFTVPHNETVTLGVYTVTGQKVRTLVSQVMQPGTHSVVWDGTDDDGVEVSSGAYIAVLRAGSTVSTRLMTLVR